MFCTTILFLEDPPVFLLVYFILDEVHVSIVTSTLNIILFLGEQTS